MTRTEPLLPSDLTKAKTQDLIAFLNIRLSGWNPEVRFEICGTCETEVPYQREFDEKLADITTELLRRYDV